MVSDYDSDFVELQWDRPQEDGGSPITGYIIEKRDKYNPNWEKCAEVEGDVNRGKVNDLVEGIHYEFRVRAVNKAGPGEPSDASKSHLARPKNRNYLFSSLFTYLSLILIYLLEKIKSRGSDFSHAFLFPL